MTRGFSVDTVTPVVAIEGGPEGLTNDPTPTFSFAANGASDYECWVDGAAPTACDTGSFTVGAALSEGEHAFHVRATDAAGNAGPVASRAFTVDTVAPNATITKRPKPKLRLRRGGRVRVAFEFTAPEAGSTFRCKLDGQPEGSCSSPKTYRVGRGKHTFRVYAIDQAGNRGNAATAVFRVVKRRN